MKTIHIKVSDQSAESFTNMSEPEKNTFSKLFDEMLADKRTLWQVMDDMSDYAKKQGLTPEKLDDILNDNAD